DSQSPRLRYTGPEPTTTATPDGAADEDGDDVPEGPGLAPFRSPHPGCHSLPLAFSMPAWTWTLSFSVGTLSALNTSEMVCVVCGPGSIPLIASTCFSTMPSGRTKSRTGSLLCAATAAMYSCQIKVGPSAAKTWLIAEKSLL